MKKLISIFWRQADVAIGGIENPYLLRWYVVPRNRWLNVYLHKFCRDDDDRALHDHPWWFVSLMLAGRYIEHTISGVITRGVGSVAFRRATHAHRVELLKRQDGTPIPCWTIVLTGARSREWGFWCPQGWVHWKDFTSGDNGELIGRGCGENGINR